MTTHYHETLIIGGGQAGLAAGYHLAKLGRDFLILDAGQRVGDSWRSRWDSMRLFTPARRDGLPGMPFPAAKSACPSRDEMAAYLERYAEHFELPVESRVRVDALGRDAGGRFLIAAGERRYEADNVVIAMGPYQRAHVPGFAADLDPRLTQLHSSEYRNPRELPDGPVLVVGGGNSGADIALELASERRVSLSGTLGPEVPFNIDGLSGRLVFPLLWQVWAHVLNHRTPIGRRALPKLRAGRQPLIRVKHRQLAQAGVDFVPRTVGTSGGWPLLADGTVLEVASVVWATGYRPGLEWIDLPVLGADGDIETDHRGAVPGEPGLYRVGGEFQYAFNSHHVSGVGRDAGRIAKLIATTAPTRDESIGMRQSPFATSIDYRVR